MANKYINHFTVAELEVINWYLKQAQEQESKRLNEMGEIGKKRYIDLRFIIVKNKNLIKKYKKIWQQFCFMI